MIQKIQTFYSVWLCYSNRAFTDCIQAMESQIGAANHTQLHSKLSVVFKLFHFYLIGPNFLYSFLTTFFALLWSRLYTITLPPQQILLHHSKLKCTHSHTQVYITATHTCCYSIVLIDTARQSTVLITSGAHRTQTSCQNL